MSTSHTNRYDLEYAAFDSMAKGAGFDPEVAADLGFITPENAEDQLNSALATAEGLRQPTTAKKVGQIICGDCCQVVPCAHATLDKKGRVRPIY